jgi:hypothetical protein
MGPDFFFPSHFGDFFGGVSMRIEYGIALDEIEIPRFSVEATEGIGKLFTLATLIMNVLEKHDHVEVVFHGLNPDDPDRRIASFKQILEKSSTSPEIRFEEGEPGQISGSSSSFRWLNLHRR